MVAQANLLPSSSSSIDPAILPPRAASWSRSEASLPLLSPQHPWPSQWGPWRATSGEPTCLPFLPALSSSCACI
jgi:hypothetical protein